MRPPTSLVQPVMPSLSFSLVFFGFIGFISDIIKTCNAQAAALPFVPLPTFGHSEASTRQGARLPSPP